MPRQSFVHKAIASAPTEHVWQALQRPESWAQIGGVNKVDSPNFDQHGDLIAYRFIASVGGQNHSGTATRIASVPGRRVVMNIDSEQLDGSIAIDLEPSGSETAITVAMTVGSKGFMTAVMFPVLSAAIASSFNETVERFVASLEV